MYPEYQKFYLFDYLRRTDAIDEKVLDYLKYELDKRIYYFGGHFKNPIERQHSIRLRFRRNLKKCYARVKLAASQLPVSSSKRLMSSAFFSLDVELKKLGYFVCRPSWSVNLANLAQPLYPDPGFTAEAIRLEMALLSESYKNLVAKSFTDGVLRFKEQFSDSISRLKMAALCVPNDLSFFYRLSIDVFQEAGLPTFLFQHGLPGRYNHIDDNRTDYLVVWGTKIKQLYVAAGVDESKILVSGHPFYKEPPRKELEFGFRDILVLDKGSQEGAPSASDKVILSDRGNSIIYLMMIQEVLQKLGVKAVRLRVHPVADGTWYHKFVDRSFFVLDNLPLDQSLTRASLLIGPTSSVLLEAIYYGKNYLLFEPQREGKDLANFAPVPPFDGSDARIPLARDEKELEYLLKNKIRIDCSVWHDYVQTPFSIDFMKRLV